MVHLDSRVLRNVQIVTFDKYKMLYVFGHGCYNLFVWKQNNLVIIKVSTKSQQSSSIYAQSTIEFRFRKSMAQERFKSYLELRYQIIVSSIKFRQGFAKFDSLV